MQDEILLASVLLPFAGVNLRTPLRLSMSISDASEKGGGAVEADMLSKDFDAFATAKVHDFQSRINEEALELAAKRSSPMCVIYVLRFQPRYPVWCICGPGCFSRTCPVECFRKH